jgi:hypothetical protein
MIKTLILLVTFALLASPAYFKFLHSVLGERVASASGIAKPAGLLVAGLVFMIVLMFERRVSGYTIDFSKLMGKTKADAVSSGGMGGLMKASAVNFDPCAIAKNLQAQIDACNKSSSGTSGYAGLAAFGAPGTAGGLFGATGTKSSSKIARSCSNMDKIKAQQEKAQEICDEGN